MDKPSSIKQSKVAHKQHLGELLVKYGLINRSQLREALKRQGQLGGQIGSILIDMGFVSTDDLLNFLSKQLGVPSANLFNLDIDQEVLKLLPLDKIKTMKILPVSTDENSLTLAMVNPQDMMTGLGTWESTFLTPDKFTAIWKVEGVKILEFIYIRVKE